MVKLSPSFIVLLLASQAASAQDLSFDDGYVRAFGGASRAISGDMNGTGPMAGAAIGVARGDTRAELEVSRREMGGTDSDRRMDTVAVNLYRQFGDGRVTPYLGAGLGVSRLEDSGSAVSDGDDGVFSGQAIMGLEYSLGGAASLSGEVRYMRSAEPDFGSEGAETLDAVMGVTLRF